VLEGEHTMGQRDTYDKIQVGQQIRTRDRHALGSGMLSDSRAEHFNAASMEHLRRGREGGSRPEDGDEGGGSELHGGIDWIRMNYGNWSRCKRFALKSSRRLWQKRS